MSPKKLSFLNDALPGISVVHSKTQCTVTQCKLYIYKIESNFLQILIFTVRFSKPPPFPLDTDQIKNLLFADGEGGGGVS